MTTSMIMKEVRKIQRQIDELKVKLNNDIDIKHKKAEEHNRELTNTEQDRCENLSYVIEQLEIADRDLYDALVEMEDWIE